MIDYGFFHFAAPRFCGASAFGKMMEEVGFKSASTRQLEEKFLEGNKCLKVSLVRHPLKWLGACYKTLADRIIDLDLEPFIELPYHSYDAFLRAYVHECPGAVTKYFDQYKSDSVLKVEELPHCLIELLQAYEVNARPLFQQGPAIIGYKLHPVDPKLIRSVMDCDRELCDRYDYV